MDTHCAAILLPATLWTWAVETLITHITELSTCAYITLTTKRMDCSTQNQHSNGLLNIRYMHGLYYS